jgi:hypothetical protein
MEIEETIWTKSSCQITRGYKHAGFFGYSSVSFRPASSFCSGG